MSEWIEWKGGECPVQGREFVEFKCPNDDKIYSHNACGLRWKHIGSMDDIIAYRIVKEKECTT